MSTRGHPARASSSGGFVARPGQIRRLGPLAALTVPAAFLFVSAVAFFLYPCDGSACVKSSLFAYLLVLLAAPTALIAGLPWFLHPLNIGVATLSSLVLWLVLGGWAGRRATDDVDASWVTYAGELFFMIAGVWGGIAVGLVVVGVWLSH